MKLRAALIISCVVFLVGAGIGFSVAAHFWSRVVDFQTVESSLSNVTSVYAPLKFLNEGQTEKAKDILKIELDGAMRNVELMATTLNRPDMLTNSSVVGAKKLK